MRISTTTGGVATGILAALALSAPAAASAPPAATPRADVLDVVRHFTSPIDARALAAAATGTTVDALPWQICGSAAAAGVGATVDTDADLVIGDCNNANAKLRRDTATPLIGLAADSAVIASAWQVCGSDAAAGAGAVVSAQVPKTVTGRCANANVTVDARHGYLPRHSADGRTAHRPSSAWHSVPEPQGIVSALSGSAVLSVPWQVCGGSAVAGVGATVSAQSPHGVFGGCDNANVHIRQTGPSSTVSVLDDASVSAGAWQVCSSTTVGGVGAMVSTGSPNIVIGDCDNANTVID